MLAADESTREGAAGRGRGHAATDPDGSRLRILQRLALAATRQKNHLFRR